MCLRMRGRSKLFIFKFVGLQKLLHIVLGETRRSQGCAWPDKQLNGMAKKGISYSSLGNKDYEGNPWFKCLVDREQLALLHTLAEYPDAETIDVSQTLGRMPKSSIKTDKSDKDDEAMAGSADDVCSTILTSSNIWKRSRARPLLGWELCSLQCIPCDALPGAKLMPRKLLTYVAGDAFCGAAFSAIVLSIFTHLPSIPERPQTEEDETLTMLGSLIWARDAD